MVMNSHPQCNCSFPYQPTNNHNLRPSRDRMDRNDSDWSQSGGGGGRRGGGMDGGGRGMGRDGSGALSSQGSFRGGGGGRDPNAHMMAERALRGGGGPGGPGGGAFFLQEPWD